MAYQFFLQAKIKGCSFAQRVFVKNYRSSLGKIFLTH
jgi:hypothetical protein